MPSPTISVGLRRYSVATASTLSDGTRLARTASVEGGPDGFGGVGTIPRDHDDP
jgi:hypothetical protein